MGAAKTIVASFCTIKEREPVTKYSQASNLSFRLAANNCEKNKEFKGKNMTDKMSPEKSFILTVIHNYLVCDRHEALEWEPDNAEKNVSQILNKKEH